MLPNEVFALACRAYYEEQGLIVDGRNGQFAHSPLTRKECNTGYYLLWEHHQQQGLIQSRDLGKCCFFSGDTKKWLLTANYFPENYFELWDIYDEFVKYMGMTREDRVANGKKVHELGIGIFGMTEEERLAQRRKAREMAWAATSKRIEIVTPDARYEFPSVAAASAVLGIPKQTISKRLNYPEGQGTGIRGQYSKKARNNFVANYL